MCIHTYSRQSKLVIKKMLVCKGLYRVQKLVEALKLLFFNNTDPIFSIVCLSANHDDASQFKLSSCTLLIQTYGKRSII